MTHITCSWPVRCQQLYDGYHTSQAQLTSQVPAAVSRLPHISGAADQSGASSCIMVTTHLRLSWPARCQQLYDGYHTSQEQLTSQVSAAVSRLPHISGEADQSGASSCIMVTTHLRRSWPIRCQQLYHGYHTSQAQLTSQVPAAVSWLPHISGAADQPGASSCIMVTTHLRRSWPVRCQQLYHG